MSGDVYILDDTYQGKPVISICWADSDKYPFNFGVGKAKLLVAALKQDPDFLTRFITENKK